MSLCVKPVLSPAGGLMGPVRMISSGHELTTDYDEKTLHELGFKDMQVCQYLKNNNNNKQTKDVSY